MEIYLWIPRVYWYLRPSGEIPVLEFRFAFIYIRTCISSIKKKLHRFFEDLLTEEFQKKKKKDFIVSRRTIPTLGKNQPFRSTISTERRRSHTRNVPSTKSLKLHTICEVFHAMNSLSSLLTTCARSTQRNLCEMIKQTALFKSKVEENRWRIHDSLKFSLRMVGQIIDNNSTAFILEGTNVKLYNSTERTDRKSFRFVCSRHSLWLSSIYPDSSTHKHFYFALAIPRIFFFFSFFLSFSLSCLESGVQIWCIFIVHDFKPTRLTRVTRVQGVS